MTRRDGVVVAGAVDGGGGCFVLVSCISKVQTDKALELRRDGDSALGAVIALSLPHIPGGLGLVPLSKAELKPDMAVQTVFDPVCVQKYGLSFSCIPSFAASCTYGVDIHLATPIRPPNGS